MKLCWEATGGAPGSCVRGPLTFTLPPRLLRLKAMVPGLKMALMEIKRFDHETKVKARSER